jgi:hypothetical protein
MHGKKHRSILEDIGLERKLVDMRSEDRTNKPQVGIGRPDTAYCTVAVKLVGGLGFPLLVEVTPAVRGCGYV